MHDDWTHDYTPLWQTDPDEDPDYIDDETFFRCLQWFFDEVEQ